MKRYKFRAECSQDVIEFIENNSHLIQSYDYPEPSADMEFEFSSISNLDEIRNQLRDIEDGHVMVQTVQLAENFTGERDYDLH